MRKKKIKILHVAQAAGGVDRYIRMLLKYLDKEKFENILVCSQDFNREDYDGLVDSFEQIEMNRAIGVSDLNSIKEVRRLIKKYNPDKEKVEFDFLTISDTPAYGDKFKKMGSTVYKVPKHINFLGYYFAIDKILREGNYDIVHIHKNSAIDILILKVLQRFPNIKVVVHSHNTFPSVGGKLEKLHKFNRKYLYDNADYRLACSDNAGKWMYGKE